MTERQFQHYLSVSITLLFGSYAAYELVLLAFSGEVTTITRATESQRVSFKQNPFAFVVSLGAWLSVPVFLAIGWIQTFFRRAKERKLANRPQQEHG